MIRESTSARDAIIGRGSCFGDPFILSDGDNVEERDMVCDAYERLLEDPMAASVHQIAQSYNPALSVDNRFASPAAGRALHEGMHGLQDRLRSGERLRLMCHCFSSAGGTQRRGQGHSIARNLLLRVGGADGEVA